MEYLAQFDIVECRYERDDLRMAEFFHNADRINKLAESQSGFVWRQTEDESELVEKLWGSGRLYTLSVWRDAAALKKFLFRTEHANFMQKGQLWFKPSKYRRHVLWRIPYDHRPCVKEAHHKMTMLYEYGPSALAFDLRSCEPPITGY
ncbi:MULTISPECIES: DUF3291 domain-containing protein [Pseudomonas]|uniref:DUF3291 domain-containing protein n=1 Tax=Pseudomonas quercus TaxID=2722792 RepID=A0ABX0YES1_9PSED|nr:MULTISPECIES: DUF3291 domain-containing protein [Pseudomonas]MBF7143065.1 DUF3291 domain-containing protein [Pseudomonas sp. LY10J]NJP01906.1 DUF3291 domain-containing protein [Pseudomonas quercus]